MKSIEVLINELESSDASTRESAARTLCEIGHDAREAVPAIYQALLREPDACPLVGTALTELGPLDPDLDSLRIAFHSGNDHIRFWATRTAVRLGEDAEPLIADLIELLCDRFHPVVDSAAWALGSIGFPAIAPLSLAARGTDPKLRGRAVLALGRYPENVRAKLPHVLDTLEDLDANVRKHGAWALMSLGQSAHRHPHLFDNDTLTKLLTALDRVAEDDSIDVEPESLDRIRGWLRHTE